MSALIHSIVNKSKFQELRLKNTFVAKLDGECCKTSVDLYNELESGFDLPDYFGKNLDALYDCLMDLEWITQDHVVLIIEHFDDLLSDEANDPELLEDFIVTLDDICKSWNLLESEVFTPKTMQVYIHASEKADQLLEDNDIEFDTI
jgi:RNAse (barnase) inhibitor barstar